MLLLTAPMTVTGSERLLARLQLVFRRTAIVMLTCRPATPDDIPWLTGTSLAAYRNVFAPLLPHLDLSVFSERFFAERFARQWRRVRIASEDSRPLGFSMTTDVNIDMFFVGEGERRGGVGRILLNDAEEHGARTLECFAVNMAARNFYERNGWVLTESYSRTYGGADCDFVRYSKP
jgi:GNAT superfamily N-acetyltransferase